MAHPAGAASWAESRALMSAPAVRRSAIMSRLSTATIVRSDRAIISRANGAFGHGVAPGRSFDTLPTITHRPARFS